MRSSHGGLEHRKFLMLREILMSSAIELMERGFVADCVTRAGIRRLCEKRLAGLDRSPAAQDSFRQMVSSGPVALVPEKANEQHYEVPAEFFRLVLGARLKYSSCYWPTGGESLDAAEEESLRITCERAQIADGQRILELGCGWGSLTLWMAENYPQSHITAVSNSSSQREFILNAARQRGIDGRLSVVTADMNHFQPEETFDRVVSVEMFEHMNNHAELLRRVSTWLNDDGKLMVHIFCHRECSYRFVDANADDWMSRHFFSGGMMPAQDLLAGYQDHLIQTDAWIWNGRHYQKTLEAWLAKMDRQKVEILPLFAQTYGNVQAERWFQRWRVFFMACSELFAYRDGEEWFVGHFRFEKR